MTELTDVQHVLLTEGGACDLHFHPNDRVVQHEQLDQIQALKTIRSISANYVATAKDDILVIDTTSGNVSVTLPLAKGFKEFTIVKSVGVNVLTILFSGGQLMFSQSSIVLTTLSDVRTLKAISGGYIRIG